MYRLARYGCAALYRGIVVPTAVDGDTFTTYRRHRRPHTRRQSIFARYGKNKRQSAVAIFHTRSFWKLIYVKPARIYTIRAGSRRLFTCQTN